MPPRNLPKRGPPGLPRPPLTPNPQLSSDWGNTSMIPDPEKEDWVPARSTSGWAPRPTHSPLSSPEAIQAPPKKARMQSDSGSSAPLSPSGLGNTSATTPFIGKLIESLRPLYESGIVDPQVDPRSVNSSAVQSMLIYVNQWAKNLENIKFLSFHPVEKDSILSSFGIMSEAFNNVGLYSKAPPSASPSPKAADSPLPSQPCPPPPLSSPPLVLPPPLFSPPLVLPPPCPHSTAPVAALVTLAAGVTAGGSARKKKKAVERSGTSRNTRAHADPPSPPPLVLHDTRPSGVPIPNLSHVTHGPIVQKPGNRCRPFNTSNGPFRQSIVVIVKSKAAPVALLPLAPQISCLIDSFLSSIMVESFCLSYGGLCLSTTSVPTPSDLSRVEIFVHTFVPEGSSVQCEVPSSHSFCKLIGMLFLHGSNPINSKGASLILSSSVYKDSICLATPPRIVRDSRQADTCTIYFDIWDSQTGSRMKSFVDHSLNVGTVVCFFQKASMKIGLPQCTRCYS